MTEYHLEFINLKGGRTGSYESSLVKMPCWKSHVAAHMKSSCPADPDFCAQFLQDRFDH